MNKNEKGKTHFGWWYKNTTKKISLKIFVAMLKVFPLLVNLYIAALICEWYLNIDKISKYIYPFIGDSIYIILMFYIGSYAFSLCNVYRLWLLNMLIWLVYEILYNNGVVIPQFILMITMTTIITFFTTLIIFICKHISKWKKKKTNVKI